MKLCVLFGSPRVHGTTGKLLDRFLSLLPDASVTMIRAYDQAINPCTACGGCSKSGLCVIRDGMDAVNRAIDEAELLVLAAPIYYSSFPAPLKAIVDRSLPYFKDSLQNPMPLRKGVALVTAGSNYSGDMSCFERTVKVFFLTRRTEFLGMFTVPNTDAPLDDSIYDEAAKAAYDAYIGCNEQS